MIGIICTLSTRLAIMALRYLVAACKTISVRIVGPSTLAIAVAVYVLFQCRLKLGGQFLDCCDEFGIDTFKLDD